ncbi:HAMP domain-containing sensor histidine kinase [Ekhidna sp.]|uniref:sensor histidine kinase n=1 Tax=Ekhidna sp. TaxID=2608089 RepID=UPI003299DB3F
MNTSLTNIDYSEITELRRVIKKLNDENSQLKTEKLHLTEKLTEANNQLKNTNIELDKHISEMREFSFFVSHNLRSPVAALKGLYSLFQIQNDEYEISEKMGIVIDHLDLLLRDMNEITNIRDQLFHTNVKVLIEPEVEKIKKILTSNLQTSDFELEADLSNARSLFSVRPVFNNILYNVLNNAVKYRSPHRDLVIKIESEETVDHVIIRIKDNGLGIDLKKNGDKIFKLYNRFHPEIDGKGMGLYLTKMQIESLGGKIEVKSESGIGAEFILYFKKKAKDSNKVLFENNSAIIFYNKQLSIYSLKWKEDFTFGDFKDAYSHSIAIQSEYLPSSWLFDFSNAPKIPVEFQHWVKKNILPAIDPSLKNIYWILGENGNNQLTKEISITKKTLEKRGIKFSLADQIETLNLSKEKS